MLVLRLTGDPPLIEIGELTRTLLLSGGEDILEQQETTGSGSSELSYPRSKPVIRNNFSSPVPAIIDTPDLPDSGTYSL